MKKPEILIIDNYDSFAHNLARYIAIAGGNTRIVRNDAISISQIKHLKPCGIVISPGPGTPTDAGISTDIIRKLGARIPILGVCLGHQCIGEAFGGTTVQSDPCHGQAAPITHHGKNIFAGIPSPFNAGRYHSLVADIKAAPDLRVTARSDDLIMAIAHKTHPIHGIQFHPESTLTEHGQTLINNFVDIIIDWRKADRIV